MIMGLGNPGAEYEHTYHNVGMMALEYLALRAGETHQGPEVSFRKFNRSRSFMCKN